MLLYTGTHELRQIGDLLQLDFAAVTSDQQSRVRVWLNDAGNQPIEDVHIAPGNPHTWWGSNSLFGRNEMTQQDTIIIEVGAGCVFRIEGAFELITGG